MAKKSPLTINAARLCIMAVVAALFWASCSQEPATYLLQVNHTPTGKVIDYSLQLERIGTMYENDEEIRDIEIKAEVDIIYTTQKILTGDIAVVLEEQKWDMDISEESGKVSRTTEEHAFRLHLKPTGKVVDFAALGTLSAAWKKYLRHYYEQGMPIFPTEKVPIGHSWTQTSTVELEDGETTQAGITYTIKGTARKLGYDCLIIDYKGNIVLPYTPDPQDTLEARGVDRIDMNGLLYFAYKQGLSVNSEERRRIIRTREGKKGDRSITRVTEAEDMVSYSIDSVGSI